MPAAGGRGWSCSARPLPLPGELAALAGRDVMVGIRAEDIEIALEPVPGAVPVELDAVTPLNVRAVLYLRSQDGKELLATVAEDDALRFGRGHRPVWVRSGAGAVPGVRSRERRAARAGGGLRRSSWPAWCSTMSARSIAAAARRR